MESFKLPAEKSQTATLGCGTLILIGLIVLFFSQAGTSNLEREVSQLRREVGELKTTIEAQTKQLQTMQESLPKPPASGKGPAQ